MKTENNTVKFNLLRFQSLFMVDNRLWVVAEVFSVLTADWLTGQLADNGVCFSVQFRHFRRVSKGNLVVGPLCVEGIPYDDPR